MSVFIVKRFPAFERSLKDVLRKYGKSSEDINKVIEDIAKNPKIGNVCSGYDKLEIRKERIPLKEYNIGRSKGVRLIFGIIDKYIVPIHIYCKTDFRSEDKVKKDILLNLKEIFLEMKQLPPTD